MIKEAGTVIYGNLEHIGRYAGLSKNLATGLRFLAETDFSKYAPGDNIPIDGDEVYAFIQEYETKVVNDTPEAHRKYADIQYLISGEEYIGVAPLSTMTEEVEAHPERDIWFYHGQTEQVRIGNGRFLVAFPEDAHAPSVAVGTPETVRKCVVKFRADV